MLPEQVHDLLIFDMIGPVGLHDDDVELHPPEVDGLKRPMPPVSIRPCLESNRCDCNICTRPQLLNNG